MRPDSISSSAPPDRASGFTLVEMLVVLTIIGLLIVLAMPRITARPAFVDRARLRTALADAISSAHAMAAWDGHAAYVDPAALGIERVSYRPMLGHDRTLDIYPDGSTGGGSVAVDGQDLLHIDWMTGRISDASH